MPLTERVLRTIDGRGGTVSGAVPAVTGSIPTGAGRVEGTCALVKDRLDTVRVTKQPHLLTCRTVRERRSFILSEAVKKIPTEP